MQKAAGINNRGGSLNKAFGLVTGGLAAAGAIPFAILWLYGQPLLTLLLGEQWLVAGHYLEIMAPWLLSVWVAAPCNAIFVVLRVQGFFLVRQTTLTAARIIAFALTYFLTADPEWTLRSFALVAVVANLLTIIHAFRVIARHAEERQRWHIRHSIVPRLCHVSDQMMHPFERLPAEGPFVAPVHYNRGPGRIKLRRTASNVMKVPDMTLEHGR